MENSLHRFRVLKGVFVHWVLTEEKNLPNSLVEIDIGD